MLRQVRRLWTESVVASIGMMIVVQVAIGRPMPHYAYYKAIREIAKDTNTPQKRSGAISELTRIARSDADNIHLRQFAVEKLGEVGATEAREHLKALAESLDWSDTTRQLKWAAFLAYWRINVADQTGEREQETVLTKALHETLQGIIATNVQVWAANELANRGAKDALPEIIKSTQFRDPTKRGEEFIQLCRTKIELLTTSPNRINALTRAIAVNDFTERQQLRRWAIDELAKLDTPDSRSVLIAHALTLQNRYYDAHGKRLQPPPDRFRGYAGEFYRRIIDALKESGMSPSAISQAGLQPDRFFTTSP